jgi:hypothetical protein
MTNVKGVRIDGASVLLGASLGAGGGAVLGWYIAKRQMEKELINELMGIKKYYADKARAAAAAGEDSDAGERAEAAMADPGGVRTTGRVITKISDPRIELVLHPRHPELEGLEEVGDGDEAEDAADEEDATDDSPPEPLVRDPAKPYVISYEEFRDENETYSKITLSYFTLDDTLCDERDAPIRDTSIVGVDFPEYFGEVGIDQPAVIYIRNDKLTVDFEIARREESYTETVLGYGKPK